MIQIIEGTPMFVVEFETVPEKENLPFASVGVLEQVYANALTDAIDKGDISKPGTYAIHLEDPMGVFTDYTIYKIEP